MAGIYTARRYTYRWCGISGENRAKIERVANAQTAHDKQLEDLTITFEEDCLTVAVSVVGHDRWRTNSRACDLEQSFRAVTRLDAVISFDVVQGKGRHTRVRRPYPAKSNHVVPLVPE